MNTKFAEDVLTGLKAYPKFLSSKYFYDATGDRLFQEIMALPEYYLTRCEYSILKNNRSELQKLFATSGNFDLIELGAGDGTKTKLLLEYFIKSKVPFTYYPIDISENVLEELTGSLKQNFPKLKVKGIAREYFSALKEINKDNGTSKKVVLFLGSNIGNFDEKTVNKFLKELSQALQPGDMVLIGFDLKKNPRIIRKAYDDEAGVTREFNLNLLNRINKELDGNFNIKDFQHYASYNPENGKALSFLISKKEQEVQVNGEIIKFAAWESIKMEVSQKFDHRMLEELSSLAGFEMVNNFYDEKKYFVDALWRKK